MLDLAIQIALGLSSVVFFLISLYTCFFFGACRRCGCSHGNGFDEIELVTAPKNHTIIRPSNSLKLKHQPQTKNKLSSVKEEDLIISEDQPDIRATVQSHQVSNIEVINSQ